jgi:hypothetical protein
MNFTSGTLFVFIAMLFSCGDTDVCMDQTKNNEVFDIPTNYSNRSTVEHDPGSFLNYYGKCIDTMFCISTKIRNKISKKR